MVRGQAVGFFQRRRVILHRVRDALLGEQHVGVIRGELQGVPVPGDQQHIKACSLRPAGQGAQDVVRFVGRALHHGDSHQTQDIL